MPTRGVKKDEFVNRALETVTMSATNTMTFQEINFAVGMFQGVGLLIHEVRYYIARTSVIQLIATTDEIQLAMSTSNQVGNLTMDEPELFAATQLNVTDHGTAAAATVIEMPIRHDFTNLPGGGFIIPANPVYAAMSSVGCTSALVAYVELLFTFKQLSDKDYIELMQSRIHANV